MQTELVFEKAGAIRAAPFKTQLLKWIGNKQRFAHEIISYFPRSFGQYYEPLALTPLAHCWRYGRPLPPHQIRSNGGMPSGGMQ